MKTVRNFVIYLRLIGGSLVFIWPFLWMAATSVKLDREMFGDTVAAPAATAPSATALALCG
jgi:ABC-type glycerol-3-phosphate transport system permease component